MSFGPTNAVTSPPGNRRNHDLGHTQGQGSHGGRGHRCALAPADAHDRVNSSASVQVGGDLLHSPGHDDHGAAQVPGQILDPFARCFCNYLAGQVRFDCRCPEDPEVDNERVTAIRPYLLREEAGFDPFRIQRAHDQDRRHGDQESTDPWPLPTTGSPRGGNRMQFPDSDWGLSESVHAACGAIVVNAIFPATSGALIPVNRTEDLPYGVDAAVCEMIFKNGHVATRCSAAGARNAGAASRLCAESRISIGWQPSWTILLAGRSGPFGSWVLHG